MAYTVKRGDSLSKIAKSHGLTVAQLLKANPRYQANPNLLNIGDQLDIPETPPSKEDRKQQTTLRKKTYTVKKSDTLSKIAKSYSMTLAELIDANPQLISAGDRIAVPGPTLGKLSEKYETGGRGPGTISSGHGDAGGISYGSYQMTSRNGGTVKLFVSQADFPWREEFAGLKSGSAAFSAQWKQLARNNSKEFAAAQHAYIKVTHFDRLVARIERDEALDVTRRARALQDAIWSTAVQHGPRSNVVRNAIKTLRTDGSYKPRSPSFDRNLIKAIYAERGKRNKNGSLAYFSRNSPTVQRGVATRFKNEEQDALRMLESE